MTSVSDSVASILYANPPIERSSSEFIDPPLPLRSDEVVAVSFESEMPKKGAQTSLSPSPRPLPHREGGVSNRRYPDLPPDLWIHYRNDPSKTQPKRFADAPPLRSKTSTEAGNPYA